MKKLTVILFLVLALSIGQASADETVNHLDNTYTDDLSGKTMKRQWWRARVNKAFDGTAILIKELIKRVDRLEVVHNKLVVAHDKLIDGHNSLLDSHNILVQKHNNLIDKLIKSGH